MIQVNTDPANPYYVPPSNAFVLGNPPTYYDIATTASFNGAVSVCLSYPANSFPAGVSPRLFHFVGNQWVDATTGVDTAARVVCGAVTSLSPFALGVQPLNRGPLVLKRLKLSNKAKAPAGAATGSWKFQADLNPMATASTFLADVASKGVDFELFGPTGRIDRVAFAATECRVARPQVRALCQRKNATHQASAEFKARATGRPKQLVFYISAKFAKRQLALAALPPKGTPPLLEVRIATPTTLGVVAANATKCKAWMTKVACVGR